MKKVILFLCSIILFASQAWANQQCFIAKENDKVLINEFPEIEDKVEVIYPAVPEQFFQKTPKEGINLLFIARYFPNKGGKEAVQVMDILTKNNLN